MPLTPQDVQAEVASWTPPEDKTAPAHPMAPAADAKPDPIQAAMAPPPAKTSPTFLDSVLSTVDNYTSKLAEHVANDPTVRMLRQGQAGFVKGVVNTVDSAASAAKASAQGLAAAEDPAHAEEALNGPDIFHPAYDHARQAALDFRDAIAVKDPSIPENLAEGAGQLMPSFLMFSRVLGSIGNTAELASGAKKAVDLFKFATADAATNATAIAPHDPRLSDTLALLQHSEGKFGDLLRQVAPDGVRSYIDYLADHKDEGEAEGRWKNVVDGWGTAAALTGVLHTAGSVFKQGWNALHYMADNNMGSMSDLATKPQTGAITLGGADPGAQGGGTGGKVVSTESAEDATKRAGEIELEDENKGKSIPMMQAPELPASDRAAASDKTQAPNLGGGMENDDKLTGARSFLKAQNDAGREGSLHSMVTALEQHMDGSTEDGAFYKDILGRLSAKNLDTKIVPAGSGLHPDLKTAGADTTGAYNHAEDTVALYPKAFSNNTLLAHTIAHEGVHAATVDAIKSQPAVKSALSGIMNEAVQAADTLKTADKYGFKNPKEFVAEAEANPRFQKLLKDTKSADGRPLWDHYKEVIGGIFGITGAAIAAPQFDKLLTKENKGA